MADIDSAEESVRTPRCMVPKCPNGRAEDHVACADHWAMIPEDERRAYWATKPYSDERRGALLRVLRFMFAEARERSEVTT